MSQVYTTIPTAFSIINRYKRIIINIYLSARVAREPPRAQGMLFNVIKAENIAKQFKFMFKAQL